MKNEKGITLVVLVITIIVLLILAGASISAIRGWDSIPDNANTAVDASNQDTTVEQNMINKISGIFDNYLYDTIWDGHVNIPQIVDGMIPVYYDATEKVWKKADTRNIDESKKWYDYTEKQWANVVTVESRNLDKYKDAEIGTKIEQSEITTMFVWIPRYSYKIVSEGNIEVSFLKGITDIEANGETTRKTIHPVFQDGSKNGYAQGGWDRELTGYWVAKFEASGLENGQAVGNINAGETTPLLGKIDTPVRIVPSAIIWRYISVGESQYKSMQMSKYGNVWMDKRKYG